MAEVDSRIGVDDKKDGIGIILPRGLAIAGALSALLLFAWIVLDIMTSPAPAKYIAEIHTPVGAGDVLKIPHGINVDCADEDKGLIIVKAKGLDTPSAATLKKLTPTARTFARGGALSRARIPKSWGPGRYELHIRVWCFGDPSPMDRYFQFNIRVTP